MISSSLKTLMPLTGWQLPNEYLSSKFQIHMSNCPLHISNSLPEKHVKHTLSKTDLLIFPTHHALHSVFPISVNDSSILVIVQTKSFESHLTSSSPLCVQRQSSRIRAFFSTQKNKVVWAREKGVYILLERGKRIDKCSTKPNMPNERCRTWWGLKGGCSHI